MIATGPKSQSLYNKSDALCWVRSRQSWSWCIPRWQFPGPDL